MYATVLMEKYIVLDLKMELLDCGFILLGKLMDCGKILNSVNYHNYSAMYYLYSCNIHYTTRLGCNCVHVFWNIFIHIFIFLQNCHPKLCFHHVWKHNILLFIAYG